MKNSKSIAVYDVSHWFVRNIGAFRTAMLRMTVSAWSDSQCLVVCDTWCVCVCLTDTLR